MQASTYSGYQYTLKIIKERMVSQILCEVLPLYINRFFNSLVESGYSLSQIRKCRTMLIQIFDAAEANGLVAGNPARKAKIIRDRDGSLGKPRYQKDTFTDEEIMLLEEDMSRDLIGQSIRILSEIKGRMMEDIVLLKTKLANPKKEVFILQFPVGEFDMVIFDPAAASREIFEIKHSAEIVPSQYCHLTDEEKCANTEHRYGPITAKRYCIVATARQ